MSAWIHEPEHIDYIVSAAGRLRNEDGANSSMSDAEIQSAQTTLGSILMSENVDSVVYRYSDREFEDFLSVDFDSRDRQLNYTYVGSPIPLEPIMVLKAIASYQYQSCEHPAWDKSFAKAFTDAIAKRYEAMLPPEMMMEVPAYGSTMVAYRDSQEWDDADTWAIGHDHVQQYSMRITLDG